MDLRVMPCSIHFTLLAIPPWIGAYAAWWIAALIVIVGLALFGRRDLLSLRWRRIWALSSVGFAESVRRKVLWITPLAILGVIGVSLLQHAADQQEAIRQTIKTCLFVSGLLVTLAAIILACTNLPREMENRVIFTIVTKPINRLEIVLGKVVGFVRLSGLIVLIMGLFSFVYLEWENWQFSGQVGRRLAVETDPGVRAVLQGYQTAGLLSTKSLDTAEDVSVYEHLPVDSGPQWITGDMGYYFVVPFEVDANLRPALEAAAEDPPRAGILIINTMHVKRLEPTQSDLQTIRSRRLPTEPQIQGPGIAPAKPIPQISLVILGADQLPLVPASKINDGKLIDVPVEEHGTDQSYTIAVQLSAEAARRLIDVPMFYIEVIPETPSVEYEVTSTPTVVDVFRGPASGLQETTFKASGPPHFISKPNRWGMQVAGESKGKGSYGVFRFRNVAVPSTSSGMANLQFRAGIERSGDYDPNAPYSNVTIEVVNRNSGQSSPPIPFAPETNSEFSIPVPQQYVAGGNFDVILRSMSNGEWIGITPRSIQFISAEHTFVFNLFKSLLILWLFSVLVVIVAVFTSTFLSWPIAVVLTLMILLGHWGVEELGDALSPGVGRSVAQDLGFSQDPTQSRVVSASVDAMARVLTVVSSVLPDVSKFPVMDDITRGVNIPPRNILDSLGVLGSYGLPMLVLAFVIFKNKEVAP